MGYLEDKINSAIDRMKELHQDLSSTEGLNERLRKNTASNELLVLMSLVDKGLPLDKALQTPIMIKYLKDNKLSLDDFKDINIPNQYHR